MREELESWKIKATRFESETLHLKEEDQKTKNELVLQKKSTRKVQKKLKLVQNKVHAMENSVSWRITKPFRAIKNAFRKLFKRG